MINVKNKPFIYIVRCYLAYMFFQLFRSMYNLGCKILPKGETVSFDFTGLDSIEYVDKNTAKTCKILFEKESEK